MTAGAKPSPPGTSSRQRVKWNHAQALGWQHGRKPAPPPGLTEAGKRAWRSWFSSWWASFWTPEDIPGLELTMKLYDGALGGHVDVSKVVPLLDRYGITPKGRQDLRWAAPESDKPAEKSTAETDEIAARRERRATKLA